SEKSVEEARAELAAADAAFKAAKARWDALNGAPLDAATMNLSAMTFTSPVSGVLERMSVAPGQTVTSGTVLFEVAAVDPVWVRVPVYIGDLNAVDEIRPARVEMLGAAPGAQPRTAKPVQGPPLGDAAAASADLFYELANPDGALRIGQKVGVTLTLRATESGLVVPWASVLFDAQGGTWVYVRTAGTVFVRQRVELRHIVNGQAVLGRGLAAGAEVVVEGAAELFGTEFGVGK
ncbi:MAG: efflux RND transporter periplasmic adaptor subunit, partial [Candidatus Aminicenantes bacterium]|nr:efflux RND transporter periplasmic adaptor subunit [Candidatus Aminicenantes bacterium]